MSTESIIAAINANLDIKALVPDTDAIATALSINRTKLNNKEIGSGNILETIGISAGNALLDVIFSQADFRHIKHLLEQGRLSSNSPLVSAAISSFVAGGVISQSQADSLVALGRSPDYITEYEVRCAIYADDGTLRV